MILAERKAGERLYRMLRANPIAREQSRKELPGGYAVKPHLRSVKAVRFGLAPPFAQETKT